MFHVKHRGMSMRNILIIENPNAGKRGSSKYTRELMEALDKAKIKYTHEVILYKGYIEEKYEDLSNFPYTDVISCGGDGTLNFNLNHFFEKDVTIGILPGGSGNDFYKMAKGTKDVDSTIQNIVDNNYRLVDVGRINEGYFINNAGFGLDSKALEIMDKMRTVFFGKLAYQSSAVIAISTYKPLKVKIVVDGVEYNREILLATLCNGTYFGGGMKLSPYSVIDDGEFELMILNKSSKMKTISLFKTIYEAKHMDDPLVECIKGKKFEFYVEKEVSYHAEGEIVGVTDILAEVLPKALRLIV